MNIVNCTLLSVCATLAFASPATAQRTGDVSSTTTYAGYYHADEGFEDRAVVGNFTNLYSGDFGFHSDLAYVNREQNATFGAAGLSYASSDAVRVKGMVGTSTDNSGILPELFLVGSVQMKSAKGWIVTPDVTYRKYRSGGREISPGLQIAKYFNLAHDAEGYYVAQADSSLSFVKDTDKTGWSVGAAITTVRNSGWTIGLNGRVGYMAYDTLTGTGRMPLRSSVIGGGASVGRHIGRGTEVFVRGNIAATDFYEVSGGMLGLKFGL